MTDAELIAAIAKGVENVHFPDPDANHREWCQDLRVYLRGSAAALLMVDPAVMAELLQRAG